MSQRHVQLLIGRLLTDDELRARFIEAPRATLGELAAQGWELSAGEIDALAATDAAVWQWTAARLPSRLQRCSLKSDSGHR